MHSSIADHAQHVPETRFGKWFLQTRTWEVHVLERAIADLQRLIAAPQASYPVVLDVGCGIGRSLPKLQKAFAPERLMAVDIEAEALASAAEELIAHGLKAELINASSDNLPVASNSVDLLFCHQTFHHLADHDRAIAEFYRVLKPGGLMLFAESTRRYIHSFIIRALFAHPMEVQKTAPEYLALIGNAGFNVPTEAISYPYLWWSREDLGLAERLLRIKPPALRDETLINLVAVKPL